MLIVWDYKWLVLEARISLFILKYIEKKANYSQNMLSFFVGVCVQCCGFFSSRVSYERLLMANVSLENLKWSRNGTSNRL